METNKQLNQQTEIIYDDDEDEVDIIGLFFELFNHIVFIGVTTILVAAITLAYNFFFITPLYESTAELYMLDSSSIVSSLTDIQIGNNLADDYMEVIQSRPVLDKVISNLDLHISYESLLNRLTVTNENDTHILSVTVKDEDPNEAKKIADEIANVGQIFIADKMGQKEPSILHYGYADGDKVSPHIVKNTVLGALIGFVCSSGIVTTMFLLNDSIKGEEDVEKKLNLSVLGSIIYEEELDEDKKKAHRGKK